MTSKSLLWMFVPSVLYVLEVGELLFRLSPILILTTNSFMHWIPYNWRDSQSTSPYNICKNGKG